MALVIPYGGVSPRLGRAVFLAPTATVVGDVEIGDEASVWFGAVLRGDVGWIRVGPRTNLQDLCCLHMTGGVTNVTVGAEVTVGHGATLHGCTVGDGCLIGIGSVVLDGAVIGDGSVVAAGALVPPQMVVPTRTLVRGVPARCTGLVDEARSKLGSEGARHYVGLASRYRRSLGEDPRAGEEAGAPDEPDGQ